MTEPPLQLSRARQSAAEYFPAVLTLTREEYQQVSQDPHTLLSGERSRMKELMSKLDERRRDLQNAGCSSNEIHRALLHVMHAFFVGDITDASRTTVPMYGGTSGDFDLDIDRWRKACDNVTQTYEYVLRALPEEISLDDAQGGRAYVRLATQLMPTPEVATHDPLELLEIVRSSKARSITWHFARSKLGIAQYMFEAIRSGYSPEELDRTRMSIDAFLGRRLFTEAHGREISILAELQPDNDYRCVSWGKISGRATQPERGRHRALVAREYTITLPGSRQIQVLYSSRSKERLFLKALTRRKEEARFLQLNGLGDGIGLMFVVDHKDLDEFVRATRAVLVPCPGSVADQNSTVGHRSGRFLDPQNRQTSSEYEAMKYLALVAGRVVEVQFVPMRAWIDAKVAHSDVNHWHYKMRKLLDDILPVLYPEHLFGIPWSDPVVRKQCFAHAITLEHE